MKTVSFLVPSYNRVAKLHRLLAQLDDVVGREGGGSAWQVLVGDNASPDGTGEFLASYSPVNYRLRWWRHERNLGADANCAFLYAQADTEFVWWFGDDDILYPGAVIAVTAALEQHDPDVLRYSFTQPYNSKYQPFRFPEECRVFSAPADIIDQLTHFCKISSFVSRHVPPQHLTGAVGPSFVGSDWYFIALCLDLLAASNRARLAVISRPLAGVDADEMTVSAQPSAWFNFWKVFTHPYVTRVRPEMATRMRRLSYASGIDFLYAYRVGVLKCDAHCAYEEAISRLRLNADLLRFPRHLAKLLILKLAPPTFISVLRRYHAA